MDSADVGKSEWLVTLVWSKAKKRSRGNEPYGALVIDGKIRGRKGERDRLLKRRPLLVVA